MGPLLSHMHSSRACRPRRNDVPAVPLMTGQGIEATTGFNFAMSHTDAIIGGVPMPRTPMKDRAYRAPATPTPTPSRIQHTSISFEIRTPQKFLRYDLDASVGTP